MNESNEHNLAVADLAARIRLALWPLVEEQPERLSAMGEAMKQATAGIEQQARQRGWVEKPASRPVAPVSRPCCCPFLCRAAGRHPAGKVEA